MSEQVQLWCLQIDEFLIPNYAKEGDVIVLTKPLGTQVCVNLKEWKSSFTDEVKIKESFTWNHTWEMQDGVFKHIQEKRGSATSWIQTRDSYKGDVEITIDISLGSSTWGNTGQSWLKIFGESYSFTEKGTGKYADRYPGKMRSSITLTRKGSEIRTDINGKKETRTIKPENLDKATSLYLGWRNRAVHIHLLRIKGTPQNRQ